MVGLGAMTDGVRIAPAGELKGKADQSKRGAWLKGKKKFSCLVGFFHYPPPPRCLSLDSALI